MQSYTITAEIAGYDGKRKLLKFLLTTGFFAAFQILFQMNRPHGMKPGYLWNSAVVAITSIAFSMIFGSMFVKRNFPYNLVVSNDSIAAVHPGYQRIVRKNEVKSITETNGDAFRDAALRVSKYGRIGTWFWGCVWIPKALPEYQSVRALVLSWKAPA